MEELNNLSEKILRCAFTVHNALGPGLLESAYEECLFYELKSSGLMVEKQKALPLVYKEIHLETGNRIDLIVNKQIILEIKSVEAIADIHIDQVLTYLKLSKCRLGLLLNFNVPSLKLGIRRFIL
ncbi:GxxExxY protein [Lacihabitans sp. CS3-21]|uniref:GxxExxY protein n=1 Tax=Lacihabitans sp. CS3-21 TaxID=2487332 RepID=UPI0020CCECC3|nr:GxxExxY protein [Lacihabitans sp. CS3-21]MCP9745462.1 GxxExxY protein [Lacihabitans sp. CS3-21]